MGRGVFPSPQTGLKGERRKGGVGRTKPNPTPPHFNVLWDKSNQFSREQQNWPLLHSVSPPGLLGVQGRQALSKRYSGTMATIILLIRASTDLKCFFSWQEHWAFAGSHQATLPRGAALAMPPTVMEEDGGWLQPEHPNEKPHSPRTASPLQRRAEQPVFLPRSGRITQQ